MKIRRNKWLIKLLKSKKIARFCSFFIIKEKKAFLTYSTCYLNRNRILVIDDNGNKKFVKKYPGLKIVFHGKNNLVILHKNIKFHDSVFSLYDNCKVIIHKSAYSIKLSCDMRLNCTLEIDEDFSSSGTEIYNTAEPGHNVKIGKDCMFSWDVIIWGSDGHAIFDKKTAQIFVPPSHICIGDHCWLGHGVRVLKGSQIPDHSIVGISSLVNKQFDTSYCVLAGQPAKIIKTGIDWDRKNTYDLKKNPPQ